VVILSKYDIAAELLLDNTPDSTIIVNDEGVIVYVNQMTINLFGYSRDELTGNTINTLIPTQFHNSHHGHMAGYFKKSRSRAMGEGQLLFAHRKDGSEFSVEISLSPINTKFGLLVICSVRNVSERIKIQTALARSNAELEQFAYVASHDLQEPLRVVASFSQLLGKRYEGKLDKDADEFIAFIVDGANRMQNLINDLLSYSRVNSKERVFTKINLNDILKEVLKNLQFLIQDSHAVINYDNLPVLNANAIQMVQLFQNLISNAIKFQSNTTPIVTIAVKEKQNEYLFSVADNGIGIESIYYKRIFQLFQRLHTNPSFSGTGIGLTLCKKIIGLHDGEIWVESLLGKGSTFYFTLKKNVFMEI